MSPANFGVIDCYNSIKKLMKYFENNIECKTLHR